MIILVWSNFILSDMEREKSIYMMRKIWLLLLIGLVSACDRKTESSSLSVLNFPVEKVCDAIKVSELTNDVELIPLETTDSLLLGEIVRVIQKDGFVYIADNENIYRFDGAGKYHQKITKRGEGPGEYLSITDFQVDASGNPWILSRNDRKLLHYDWNGSLLQQFSLPCWALKISLEEDSNLMYLYAGNEKDEDNSHQVKLLNLKSGQVEKNYLPIDEKKSAYLHVFSNNCFSATPSGTYFFQLFNDTVYQFSSKDKELQPAYYLNLGEKNIPASFFGREYRDIMDFFQHLHANKYAYGTGLFMKNEDVAWISYIYDKKVYWGASRKESCLLSNVLKEDVFLQGYPIAMSDLKFYQQGNEEVFLVLWPGDIVDYLAKNLNEAQQQQLQDKIGILQVEGNPILLKLGMPYK